MFLALFGLFLSVAVSAPILVYVVGVLCILLGPLGLMGFGLVMSFSYSVPVWVFVVGALCAALDFSLADSSR